MCWFVSGCRSFGNAGIQFESGNSFASGLGLGKYAANLFADRDFGEGRRLAGFGESAGGSHRVGVGLFLPFDSHGHVCFVEAGNLPADDVDGFGLFGLRFGRWRISGDGRGQSSICRQKGRGIGQD